MEFLELLFLDSSLLPDCILFDFLDILKSFCFQMGFDFWKWKSCEGWSLGEYIVKPREYCAWPKTTAQVMVTDRTPKVLWDDHTLNTFLSATAINNGSVRECYKLSVYARQNLKSIYAKRLHSVYMYFYLCYHHNSPDTFWPDLIYMLTLLYDYLYPFYPRLKSSDKHLLPNG